MDNTEQKNTCQFFHASREDLATIRESLAEIVRLNQKSVIEKYMQEENMLHFSHGTRWGFPANSFSENGEMQEFSAEYSIKFQQIMDADFSIFNESILSISNQMSDSFERMAYETINEACDKSGNVIKGKDFLQSFLDMLEKIDFSVDRNGDVQLPQLHVGGSFNLDLLQNQPIEFSDKVEEIKARKSAAALESEKLRKSKFKVKAE